MRLVRTRFALLASVALTVTSGCDVAGFDRFRADTPVIAVRPPVSTELSFGGEVAVISDGRTHDRLLTSGGIGSDVVTVELREDRAFLSAARDFDFVCGGGLCEATRNGASLAGLEGWADGAQCGFTSGFGTVHSVRGRCFPQGGTASAVFTLPTPSGFEQSGFGLGLAAPRRRRADEPAVKDLLAVGAPGDLGAVFVLTPTGATRMPLDDLPTNAGFGTAVAIARARSNGDTLVAATALGLRRAYLFRVPLGGAPVLAGCAREDAEIDFGNAVALGDVDGDGAEDMIVTTEENRTTTGAQQVGRVHAYLARAMRGDAACEDAWPGVSLGCTEGARCGGFGHALAVGDLDADGADEVVVGAPAAQVLNAARAGAVSIVRAVPGTDGNTFTLREVQTLRDEIPRGDAQVGRALAVAWMGTRDELIAGVPGVPEVRVYRCTGIPGDSPGDNGLGMSCAGR